MRWAYSLVFRTEIGARIRSFWPLHWPQSRKTRKGKIFSSWLDSKSASCLLLRHHVHLLWCCQGTSLSPPWRIRLRWRWGRIDCDSRTGIRRRRDAKIPERFRRWFRLTARPGHLVTKESKRDTWAPRAC